MATVTGLTADRMLEIEAASVIDGDVVGNNLILTKHDGSQINAGDVRGPTGPQGPVGSDLAVLSSVSVLEMGVPNQIRAGRQLTPADFGNLGLSAPLGLWNLSDLSDASGNGRSLSNKGSVTFNNGIMGGASNAAQFAGSTAQALYIPDTGVNDPFRIKVGTWGCWFKCPKRGSTQYIMSKIGIPVTPATVSWASVIYVTSNGNVFGIYMSDGTNVVNVTGLTDVVDDRWHFGVNTYDGTQACAYVDGQMESQTKTAGLLMNTSSAAPLNIGGNGGDAGTATNSPYFGRVDEAFVTSDVLNEDQIRNLYCARIGHTLGAIPSRLTLNIRRRRRGAAVVPADFPALPSRLHNFSAGSLVDEGSNSASGSPKTLVPQGAGTIVSVSGVDGSPGNAMSFSGAHQGLAAHDGLSLPAAEQLPSGLNPRSLGLWFKTNTSAGSAYLLSYGVPNGADTRIFISPTGFLAHQDGVVDPAFVSGSLVIDGLWHHGVIVEDNTASDLQRRKMYIDGRLNSASGTMGSVILGGATRFRIGAYLDGTAPLSGQIDGAFVYPGALTAEQISVLYNKSLIAFSPSPKNVGDHVEAMSVNDLLVAFDSLDSAWRVDLAVAA